MTRLALLATIIAGCTTTESSDVFTSGIYASISAETKGDGVTTVGATLFVGNPIGLNFVQLTGDDSLVAKSSSQSKTMTERVVLNTVVHEAELTGDAEGAQFEVVFDRAVDAGAPSSIATLPAKFDIATAPQTASRAQTLTLSWSPAGSTDLMSWSASGDCIEAESAPITGDPGTVAIAADTLKKRMGANIPDQCAVTFTIKRSRPGLLDPHYQGGTVYGTQDRTVVVTSTQ